ncbi:hypothetical protein DSO57_1001994 [Entomophthora muscae]|uniref:Uncharacterized protein n=1 Tax=Entomophthora muscae TaxID=34485 RepID=A0ACC2RNW3_9FUNG|nr:hypothetical protein DSO57_1001994 [Entomophthora muscae]
MSCPHTPSATNGAHYMGPMYSSVKEDSTSPSPLLTGFHERYEGAPMETSDIKRDCWFCQEEEIIDRATIINVASNLITGYQLAHEPASVEFLLLHCHPDAQQLLASFWSFLNSEAGSLDQLPNVKQVRNCIQSFVHPAIHHLLGVQAHHHMEVQDLVPYSNHQREYQAALVHCLDLSFAEHAWISQRLNALLEQLNTQLPNIVGEILDLRRALQTWCQDVTRHILVVEHYVEDAACCTAAHLEETGCCTSELADTRSKLEALKKEFSDFSQTNQSELSRLKDLAHAAEAKIVKLKDAFVKYDDHLQMTLEEKLTTFCKETEEALLLAR